MIAYIDTHKERIGVEPICKQLLIALLRYERKDFNFLSIKAKSVPSRIGTRAVQPLIRTLKHDGENTRNAAAMALGEIKDPRAVQPLIAALDDSRWIVIRRATTSLGKIKDTRAVDPLARLLKHEFVGVRVDAAWALGEIGGPRALGIIFGAFDILNDGMQENDTYTRREVVETLGKLKDPRAVELLNAALKDSEPSVRKAAASSLDRM